MKLTNGFVHLLNTAWSNFRRNKVRTVLTSLGIMIGVLSVVLLIALGIGLKNYLKQQFESLGSNLIIIFPGNVFSEEGGIAGGFGPGFAGGADFDEKDVKNLKKIREADYVVPLFFKSTVVEYNGESYFGYIEGSNEEIFPVLNLEPIAGEIFTKSDAAKKKKIGVLGYSIAEDLFDDPETGVGKKIQIGNQKIQSHRCSGEKRRSRTG